MKGFNEKLKEIDMFGYEAGFNIDKQNKHTQVLADTKHC
jgi:hypothetical protein